MSERFYSKEEQKEWENYCDYVNSHYGQAHLCMTFTEWKMEKKENE